MSRKVNSRNPAERPAGLILRSVYNMSDKVTEYASDLQMASRKKYFIPKSRWMPLAREALEKLHESAVTYHRSTECLAESGWAHNSIPLQRTLIDITVNAAVIVEKDSEMRAFRYMAFDLLKVDANKEQQEEMKKEIKKTWFDELSEKNKKKAEDYINKRKLGLYWYSGTYNGPRDVMRKIARSLLEFYGIGGSASHGGELGYKFFDENPNLRSINPRKDPYSANLATSFSLRLLLEFCRLRDQFEELNLQSYYDRYVKEYVKLEDIIERTKKDRALFK